MKKLLLNIDDFIYWADLSKNIKEKQLNPHIIDAQVRFVEGSICSSLYDEVYDQFLNDSLTSQNEVLFKDYIIPLLVFASYVNYLVSAGKRSTESGMIKLVGDNLEHITRDELKELVSENKEKRSFYQNRVSDFLKNNTDTYPLFKDCCKTQKSGFGITSITNHNK